jgi:hypothetical protein
MTTGTVAAAWVLIGLNVLLVLLQGVSIARGRRSLRLLRETTARLRHTTALGLAVMEPYLPGTRGYVPSIVWGEEHKMDLLSDDERHLFVLLLSAEVGRHTSLGPGVAPEKCEALLRKIEGRDRSIYVSTRADGLPPDTVMRAAVDKSVTGAASTAATNGA